MSTAPTQFSDHLRRETEMRSRTRRCLHVHSGQHTCNTNLCYKSIMQLKLKGFCPPMGCFFFNALSATSNFPLIYILQKLSRWKLLSIGVKWMDHYWFYLSKSCITTISDCFVRLILLGITTDSIILYFNVFDMFWMTCITWYFAQKTKQKINKSNKWVLGLVLPSCGDL